MTVVKDRHWQRNGKVTENPQFREIPVRAVTRHRAFRENLRGFGVDQRAKKFRLGQGRQFNACQVVFQAFSCASPALPQRLQVIRKLGVASNAGCSYSASAFAVTSGGTG
jgi:hypothetical protein